MAASSFPSIRPRRRRAATATARAAAAGGGKSSNAGGQSAGKSSNAGGQRAGKSSNAGGKASATQTASVDKKGGGALKSKKAAGEQKASATSKGSKGAAKKTEVAATEDAAPSKKSALGRWNAVKPIDHPAVQAHIRNGNFNGTIGLNAAYVLAQTEYDTLEKQDLAAAQALVKATETYSAEQDAAKAAIDAATTTYNEANGTALTSEQFVETTLQAATDAYNAQNGTSLTVVDYKNGLIGGTITPSSDVEQALVTQAQPTPEGDVVAAQKLLDDAKLALDALAAAEKAMEEASNRGAWSDIRADVRAKMNLEPGDNDVQEAADAAAPTETPEVTEAPDTAQPDETPATAEEAPLLEETASAQ